MKWVVVDTNIIFSALIKSESKIREILGHSEINFCAPNYLIAEIFKHRNRIVELSEGSEEEVTELLAKLLARVKFINEDMIPTSVFIGAYQLCKDVDEKDTPFVALCLELDCELWTGDEKLKNGLRMKGFDRFFQK
ncbi:MAG: PIN domain-containing protein [Phaeodactylibacter sp.]|nr:PIN domain-containing protein [Phaeodactylibacter sp.]MCB9050486.1 PIN domain-containing protein [Lewinellaceae bacterium]